MRDPIWTLIAAPLAAVMTGVAVTIRSRHAIRRRLGLWLFGLALILLGEPISTAYCHHCGRWVRALCKAHVDELAASR